jgi:hypothetical protein
VTKTPLEAPSAMFVTHQLNAYEINEYNVMADMVGLRSFEWFKIEIGQNQNFEKILILNFERKFLRKTKFFKIKILIFDWRRFPVFWPQILYTTHQLTCVNIVFPLHSHLLSSIIFYFRYHILMPMFTANTSIEIS